jgi:diketogulonate reductase-like aldo/keto reductase
MRQVQLLDGTTVPALGQGTWRMGEGQRPVAAEAAALRLGVDLGLTLIDTAEMYGDGRSEAVVAEAIAGRRDEVFLVSKVYPQNARRGAMAKSCEASLARLKTDHLDLYLLHWRGGIPLAETVEAFESLRQTGKIVRWGVSNLDVSDMEELGPGGCATNQVLYNPQARGIEFDLLPWCAARHMPVMAYSPVGQGGTLLRHKAVVEVASRHDVSPAAVAIAWSIRMPGIISIPKAADPEHVSANAAAAELELVSEDFEIIDAAFPPPRRPQPLEML